MNIEQWKSLGNYHTVLSKQVFVIDKGSTKETLVVLHGYPTSSYDYYKVLDQLSEKFRVVIHDHPGFGDSDKPLDYSYSLIEQAEVALKLWEQLGITNATILAHDYGTSIATEILALSQNSSIHLKIESIILCNGSVHIELAKLHFIQKLLKHKTLGPIVAQLSSQRTFVRNMKNIWYDASKVSIEELKEMWHLLLENNGRKVLPKQTQYINERYLYWNRWVGALKQTVLPIKIVWTTEDPIAIKAIAQKLHSEILDSELHFLEKSGHFPMLETPNEWLALIFKALKK